MKTVFEVRVNGPDIPIENVLSAHFCFNMINRGKELIHLSRKSKLTEYLP